MVFKAMSLNDIIKEVNVDRKEKSKDWALRHSNIKYLGRWRGTLQLSVPTLLLPHPHNSLSLPYLCPIQSAQSAYSCHFSGTDFCWPVLSCDRPSPALTDQFQDCSEALEIVLANSCPQRPVELFESHLAPSGLTLLPKYRVGRRQMAWNFQSEKCFGQSPLSSVVVPPMLWAQNMEIADVSF